MKQKIKKDAVILTARDLLNGYVTGNSSINLFNITPLQMIPDQEKTEEWKKWNLDWLERAGMRQLSRDSRRIVKNYHLANGLLDRTDYIISPENDMNDMIDVIVGDNINSLPIKFFPLIPNVINVLCGEFAKRTNRIIAKAVDQTSVDEVNQEKEQQVVQILMEHAEQKKMQEFQAQGLMDKEPDENTQKQMDQEMETSRKLVQTENQFKTYRGRAEQWANHIIELDTERFAMYQLEGQGFRDSLVADREFWHIKILDGDYKVELWNPVHTFYHKSPDTQWISEGNYVGRILLMSIPDVIDNYGPMMNEEQLEALKTGYRTITHAPLVDDAHKGDASQYNDYSKPYPNNVVNTTMARWTDSKVADSILNPKGNNEFNMPWFDMNKLNTDFFSAFESPGMVRVTEAYWKSQRKYGKLTKITSDNITIIELVDENFVVTEEPVYDRSIRKTESVENLVSGEHVDWTYGNETRYGIKINSSITALSFSARSYSGFEPIYIGGDALPFQFRGQDNIYGTKLAVEGKIFSERNSYSSGIVDKMKAWQVSFNIANNQILEMLADDPGNVIVLDQNMIPRNSMGGEWGPHNFPMFHQIMRDYSIAAVDPSIRNTEGATNFAHFQAVDMSKTNQIIARIQLAQYFKQQCFEVVGIMPQRLGAVAAQETATGVQQAVNNSYAQTEPYFDQHMNYLMPRVRQMMLDAAQFTNASKPISRVTYLNSNEENVFFDIEGYKLLLRDFHVYAKSTADIKATVDQLKQMAMQNNTAGGSLADIAQVLSLNSPAEIISKMKEAEQKRQDEQDAQRQHEQQMQQEQQQFLEKETEKAAQREDHWKEKELETQIIVAQIRASQSKDNDVNSNSIPDSLEALDMLHNQQMDAQSMLNEHRKIDLTKDKQQTEAELAREKLINERQKMASQERIEAMKLKNPVVGEKSPKKK